MEDRAPELERLLGDFGLDSGRIDAFFRGEVVVYPLPTQNPRELV